MWSQVRDRLRDTPNTRITPILVPVGPETSFEALIDRTSNVSFDFSGQGMPVHAGWITDRAAWLVWDPDERKHIVGGFQMFGSVTWMAFWTNGYRALALLDDDDDGLIRESELVGVALWHDSNADGVCDAREVVSVMSHGVVSIAYDHERVGDDLWTSEHGVTFANGRTVPTYDWTVSGHPARVTR